MNAENAPSANNQVPPMIQPSYGVPQTAQQYDAINPPTQRQSTIAPPPLPPTALNNAHHQFQTGAPVDLLQQQWFQSQQIHADRFGGSPPPMAGSLETSHSNFAAQSNFNNISSNHSSVFEAVTNRNDYYQESRQSHSRERRRTTRDDSRSRPTDYKRNFDKIADSEENERSRTNADGDRENKRSRRNRSSSREANRKQESSSSRREQRESSKSRYRDNSRERKYRKDRDDFSDRRRRERY